MKRPMIFTVLSACLAFGFLFLSVGSAIGDDDDDRDRDRENGFKGTWVCHAQHGGQGPRPLALIFDLTLGKSERVSGFGTIAGVRGMAHCGLSGTFDRQKKGWINLDFETTCDIPYVGEETVRERFECSGSGKTSAGFGMMTCLDLTIQNEQSSDQHNVLTMAFCDRK